MRNELDEKFFEPMEQLYEDVEDLEPTQKARFFYVFGAIIGDFLTEYEQEPHNIEAFAAFSDGFVEFLKECRPEVDSSLFKFVDKYTTLN